VEIVSGLVGRDAEVEVCSVGTGGVGGSYCQSKLQNVDVGNGCLTNDDGGRKGGGGQEGWEELH
jgi:hypothetical protein